LVQILKCAQTNNYVPNRIFNLLDKIEAETDNSHWSHQFANHMASPPIFTLQRLFLVNLNRHAQSISDLDELLIQLGPKYPNIVIDWMIWITRNFSIPHKFTELDMIGFVFDVQSESADVFLSIVLPYIRNIRLASEFALFVSRRLGTAALLEQSMLSARDLDFSRLDEQQVFVIVMGFAHVDRFEAAVVMEKLIESSSQWNLNLQQFHTLISVIETSKPKCTLNQLLYLLCRCNLERIPDHLKTSIANVLVSNLSSLGAKEIHNTLLLIKRLSLPLGAQMDEIVSCLLLKNVQIITICMDTLAEMDVRAFPNHFLANFESCIAYLVDEPHTKQTSISVQNFLVHLLQAQPFIPRLQIATVCKILRLIPPNTPNKIGRIITLLKLFKFTNTPVWSEIKDVCSAKGLPEHELNAINQMIDYYIYMSHHRSGQLP
jgi:hypothetical protein